MMRQKNDASGNDGEVLAVDRSKDQIRWRLPGWVAVSNDNVVVGLVLATADHIECKQSATRR